MRYTKKLELVDGIDSYKVAKGDWQGDVDLYLILASSLYSEKNFFNDKSQDCYHNLCEARAHESSS